MLGLSLFMLLLVSLVAAAPPASPEALMKRASSMSAYHQYNKGSDVIRGVNLGGWLVLEPWMNSDLFSKTNFPDGNIPADEFNFCSVLGTSKCGQLLESHYSSWITEDDFKQIKAAGLNAVRIPIGYWAFFLEPTDKYYKGGQEAYLKKALGWARTHGISVWIDLHGAPGSQNGYDNSGHKYFHDWAGYNNMADTTTVLKTIFNTYGGDSYKDVVIGIELVNEPLVGGSGVTQDTLSNWYQTTITAIRNDVGSNQNIILHDGYTVQGAWTGKSYNNGGNIIYDTHLYMLYDSSYTSKSYEEKISQVCTWGNQLAALNYKEVVGEFTAAFQNDGTTAKGIESWGTDDKEKMSRFVQAQFNAFEKNYGWFFWNWKMGGAADQWDFQLLLKNSIIPSPVTSRTYSDCK